MALKIDPYLAAPYNNLGYIYLAEGLESKAKENFDHSLMLNPFFTQARNGLTTILLKHSEYQKAIDLCIKNLEIVKDDQETIFLLIDIYIHQKDFVNVKKYALRVINANTDPKFLTRLGVKLAQNNINDGALYCFIKAIRVAPDYNEAYWDMGEVLVNLGKYDEAVNTWEMGLKKNPFDERLKQNIDKIRVYELKATNSSVVLPNK